jgi:hypothetical protein
VPAVAPHARRVEAQGGGDQGAQRLGGHGAQVRVGVLQQLAQRRGRRLRLGVGAAQRPRRQLAHGGRAGARQRGEVAGEGARQRLVTLARQLRVE